MYMDEHDSLSKCPTRALARGQRRNIFSLHIVDELGEILTQMSARLRLTQSLHYQSTTYLLKLFGPKFNYMNC